MQYQNMMSQRPDQSQILTKRSDDENRLMPINKLKQMI